MFTTHRLRVSIPRVYSLISMELLLYIPKHCIRISNRNYYTKIAVGVTNDICVINDLV